jgi:hypothetical protein
MLVQVQIDLQRLASPLGWVEHVGHKQHMVDSELPSLITLSIFHPSVHICMKYGLPDKY